MEPTCLGVGRGCAWEQRRPWRHAWQNGLPSDAARLDHPCKPCRGTPRSGTITVATAISSRDPRRIQLPTWTSPELPKRGWLNAAGHVGLNTIVPALPDGSRLPPSRDPGSVPHDSAVPYGFGGAANAHTGKELALSSLLPSGSDAAFRGLLAGRRTAILWDLDNVDFFAPACSAPLQVRRLRALVTAAGGRLVLCRAYGNTDTVRRLAGILPLLEGCGLLGVEPVAVRRDAADLRLVEDAMEFAEAEAAEAAEAVTHGSVDGPALLCVSQDTDFAAPLRYLSERGVRTVAVSPHDPRRRTHAAMEPATYFRRLPLPTSCWAALKWEPLATPVTATEADWLQMLLASVQEPDASPGCRSGTGDVASALTGDMEWLSDGGKAVQEGRGLVSEAAVTAVDGVAKGAAAGLAAGSSAAAAVEAASAATTSGGGGGGRRLRGTAVVGEVGAAGGRGGGGGSHAAAAAPGATQFPGLSSFMREGALCPGAATRLWLNSHFPRS
ncbi:hypothetical protein PLESTB_000349700 [Pleodorina starrii]|uniref:NYN domain-containing protein n=1 Tax=Pleodorina starrii TaxID=330485 RepID=A0A9W6BE70_9CHLO|nr:hypothetical protein PLESTM_000045300 [Pleodorina starrii]GLC50165.1 hypothetical protein PLESTB_000349700 [Pleodorina starrii]GLC73055.1 hypothetical protein PLESTF_001326800 [Pleodorina starrii]